MNRCIVPDGKLDLLAIDQVECFQLWVVLREILKRALLEYCLAVWRAHDDFRLEKPRGVAILLRLHLLVDEEQRNQSRIPNWTRHIANHGNSSYSIIWAVFLNSPFCKLDNPRAAKRNTLPAIKRLARIWINRLFTLCAIITAPRNRYLNIWKVCINGECEPHRGRNKGT